ncbi:hypothetical protein BGX21_006545 [Mortierella sp. AD011]|nr:hypothetical protein BGX20_007252 [Mortierella sp. AD010]KAF9403179.1 hypothetical protein BGX21_006545 [Mortierella sp. AD011]
MNDLSERHPSCVHSATLHHSMSISSESYAGSGSCSCEECSRYKLPLQSEQTSATDEMLLQHANTTASPTSSDRDSTATSSTLPPTTYVVRRASASNTVTSPKMQPAGFGLGGSSASQRSAQMYQPQRRASLEFNNRERSFQQHSTACDCRGSGVGCGCSYACNC